MAATEPSPPRRSATADWARPLAAVIAAAALAVAGLCSVPSGAAALADADCATSVAGLTGRQSRVTGADGPAQLITVTNHGDGPVTGLTLLDASVADTAPALEDAPVYALASGPGRIVWQGDLPPGHEVTLTRPTVGSPDRDDSALRAEPVPPDGAAIGLLARTPRCLAPLPVPLADGGPPLHRNAQVVPAAGDPDRPTARLQAQGRRSDNRVAPGETFRYTITVLNHGPSSAREVMVTDSLPKDLSFVSSTDACTARGQKVTCGPMPLLAPGVTATWVILVRLNPAYTGTGSEIANQGTVTSDTPDPAPANNTGPHPGAGLPNGDVTGPTADLAITKKPSGPGPVAPGETFEYLITAVNQGPSEAKTVAVTDQLPPALAFVGSPSGCTGPADTYGATLTCPSVDTLAPTASKTFAVTVRLDPDFRGAGSAVVNRATVGSATPDPDPGNNTAAVAGLPNPDNGVEPAAPIADHTVTVSSAAAVHPGRASSARLTVTNLGPSGRRQPASVLVTMPPGTTVPSTGLPRECTAEDGGRQLRCTIAPGRAGDGPFSVTFPVLLAPSVAPGAELTGGSAVVRSPEDRNSGNDSASWTATALGGSADLETTKQAILPAGKSAVAPGDVFTYRVTVGNLGPSDARRVTVTDPLPAPLAFVSSPDGCTATGRTVSCPSVSSLPAGGTARFDLVVRLAADFRGTGTEVDNIATATSATDDPVPGNNSNRSGTTGPDGGPLPVRIPPDPVPTPTPVVPVVPTPTPTPVPVPVPDRGPLPDTGIRLPGWLPLATAGTFLTGAGSLLLSRRLRGSAHDRRKAGS
ncbi:DUF11 domain-containing protein [Kitasatospora sp. NBC_00070]|uniref:DUF11 domain-containing protein n=1 Tax=Kitasatospora sp. NBC_00070 TaxID=2975962 RepID=UPI00324D9A02